MALSRLDEEIIELLKQGIKNPDEIGKKLNIDPWKVYKELNRLVEKKVITAEGHVIAKEKEIKHRTTLRIELKRPPKPELKLETKPETKVSKVHAPEANILLKSSASYFGGHQNFTKNAGGNIIVTDEEIIFVKSTILGKGWSFTIPFEKIKTKEVVFGSDGSKERITIPFVDESKTIQKPVFWVVKNKDFNNILFEKIPTLWKKIKKTESILVKPKKVEEVYDDEAMRIIKLRYAKGEISKEQFEQMKKDIKK